MKKSGAWYTYEGEQLGQGRENAKQFLRESPELMVELDDRIRQEVMGTAEVGDEIGAHAEDDEPITLED